MTMKILGLQVQGVGPIKAMEMKFKEKGLIPFVGVNNQGKTTILKCLEMLISGGVVPSDIINHDSKKGVIVAQIGEYTIKKVMTDKTTRLEVSNEKSVIKSPQSFLDSLINTISFNPFSYINKTPLEKIKDMMEFSGIDFTGLNQNIKEAEQDRLVVGRLIKDFGALESVEEVTKIDVLLLEKDKERIEANNKTIEKEHSDKLLSKQKEVLSFNEDVRKKKEHFDTASKRCMKLADDILTKEKELSDMCDNLKRLKSQMFQAKEDVKGLEEKTLDSVTLEPAVIGSTAEIDSKIEVAKEQNVKAEKFKTYKIQLDKLTAHKDEKISAEKRIDDLKQEKKDQLKNAKLPVEGLEIREDGIYFNGTYSENLSTSEAIKLACELCLSKKPKLRAITIDRGESFDLDNLKYIEEWGEKNDMQCFITIVDTIPENKQDGVFYIEEGGLCE